MPVIALAGQPRALRVAGERAAIPDLAVVDGPIRAATGLVADIGQDGGLAAAPEGRSKIFRLDTVAGEFRAAIRRLIDIRPALGNVGATDIA